MSRPGKWMRQVVTLAAVLAVGLATVASAQRPAVRKDHHVILISLDGFAAENLDDPRIPLPNIRALAAAGARADRMTVSTPSVTWPNHTTLVTGVLPAKHGVIANGAIEPSTGATPLIINPRRSKEELTRFTTLYDVAHEAGLITAEVNWPVTRGARSLNWSFPDYPDSIRYSTPILIQELQAQKVLPTPTDEAFRAMGSIARDAVWTQAAIHLLRRYRPNLLLLHLLNTDGTQHANGPGGNEAITALSLADRYVGDIVEAVNDLKIADRTTIFVTADHGFMRVTKSIKPNARLRSRELIRPAAGSEGAQPPRYEYDAQVIPEGGVAFVYVPNGKFRPELVSRTRDALAGLDGVDQLLTPAEYSALGMPIPSRSPQAPDFVLTARDGYAFSAEVSGEEVVTQPRATGSHGYVHTNPRMDALFVAGGRGIVKGTRIERCRNIDVAPTIARLMNLELRDVDGQPLTAILEASSAPAAAN